MYPRNIEEKLGFDRVKILLKELCVSEGGKKHVDQMKWLRSQNALEQRLESVRELQTILQSSSLFYPQIPDLKLLIDQLNTKGSYLKAEEIHEFKQLIQEILDLHSFMSGHEKEAKQLNKTFKTDAVEDLEAVGEAIHQIIDPEGNMRPDASPLYAELSAKIDKINRGMLKKVNQLYAQSDKQGWAAETGVSIRDGRYVIPISAEHKRKLKGIVHDESKGGKIFYIEPIEILESTNELKETELERKREEVKILKKITKELALNATALKQGSRHLQLYDFIKAKALFAEEVGAFKPAFSANKSELRWMNAKHPLLYLNLKEEGEEIVPLTISLNEEHRMIIISGPNAGGKSVTLKTVALNQYMWQSGMLVCCDPESEMALFDELFIDIGDDQSIDNNLSSYSSHLKAMKHFINQANENTLFLIDELGSGTDPQFGGPIGEAVLEMLHEKGAKGLITTHFSNIKGLAEKKEAVINASMAYDPEHLEPLYEFQMGKPGSSFAFEVARKIGLNKKLLEIARKRTNFKQQKVDVLLAKLEKQTKDLENEKLSLDQQIALNEKLKSDYEALRDEIKADKKNILEEANRKAGQIIKDANKEIENVIKSIKESEADKKTTRDARKKLEKKSEKLLGKPGVKGKKDEEVIEPTQKQKIEVGSRVQLPGSSNYGEVVEIRKGKATVMAGMIKTSFPLEMLEVTDHEEKERSNVPRSFDLVKKQQSFSAELDIRGERTDEALKKLDEWIDTAIVTGFTRLRVIHGKGHGILKDRIRNHLKDQPFIESIEYESIQLGGEGVSIIHLK